MNCKLSQRRVSPQGVTRHGSDGVSPQGVGLRCANPNYWQNVNKGAAAAIAGQSEHRFSFNGPASESAIADRVNLLGNAINRGVKTVIDILNAKSVNDFIDTGVVLVTKDNIDQPVAKNVLY
jgi:ABC-type sugar transport system substrate-binding protein